MNDMKAKMFCPNHGKLSFEEIQIKNGIPICVKCSSELEFGTVRPRKLKDDGHK
jgi:hypothetical protein